MAVRVPPQGPDTDGAERKMRLMDHQDLTRGDGTGDATRMVSFRCPVELYDEAKHYGKAHHLSFTTLIVQGLDWRLEQEH